MAGRFVTFEGGEGSGKSTQIALLARRLEDRGIATTVTREPGGTPTAEAIRDLILSGRASRFGPEGEALLFAAARADHVDTVIRPALASGRWVLSDRFYDSTRVYQGAGDGVDPAFLKDLETKAAGDTVPDLTVILDIPVELGLARAARRMSSNGHAPDRFESDGLAKHDARRQAFLTIARDEPDRCMVVAADGDERAVSQSVWAAVAGRLLDGDS